MKRAIFREVHQGGSTMLTMYVVEKQDKAMRDQVLPVKFHSQRVDIVGVEEDLPQAFWEITELQPTLVFIELDDFGETGIHFSRQLNQLKHPPQIIFIASDDTYVQQAIEIAAFDYVIKPFEAMRLKQIVEKLMYEHDQKRFNDKASQKVDYQETIVRNKYTDKFIIKMGDRIRVINTDEIVYIGTENRQVFVKTVEGRYNVDTPLYLMEERLGPSFIRVHRSFIINIYYIVEIQPWFGGSYTLLFKDGSSTPISRSHIKAVRRILEF